MPKAKEVTIPLEEYKRLIKAENKYEQLKSYIIRNINNDHINKAMGIIEQKHWCEVINEWRMKEEK